MLTSFITSSVRQKRISPQEFWMLREFYAPGALTVNKTATTAPFLVFKSDKITSYESLVPRSGLNSTRLTTNINNGQVDFKTDTELIYHDNRSLHIVFLKPVSEMITANAVYDYKDKDKKFLEGKLWYADTTINIR